MEKNIRITNSVSICENIVLIGMSGVGKSYLSHLLARKLKFEHLDLDVLIQAIIKEDGIEKDSLNDAQFLQFENRAMIDLPSIHHVIVDTGGSVVYSAEGMAVLGQIATLVYIKDDFENIEQRFKDRGFIPLNLVGIEGKTFRELFMDRKPLYEKYADITVERNRKRANDGEKVVDEIIAEWHKFCKENR